MNLNKVNSILAALLVVFALCSCRKEENALNVELSPTNLNVNELVSVVYDESQLYDIVQSNNSIDTLNNRYPIECLRKSNGILRASFLGDASVAVLLFDQTGSLILENIYHTSTLSSDFKDLTIGDSLKAVQSIDPDGSFVFLYTGRDDTPKMSTHYTRDGYLITIEYNASSTITKIDLELL